MTFEYEIDYKTERELSILVETEEENAAVDRLARFNGTEQDVRTAARLYEKDGKSAKAALLLEMLA